MTCNIFCFTVNILQDIDQSVRNNNPVDIMKSFSKESDEIKEMLVSPQKLIHETAGQIVTFLGKFYFYLNNPQSVSHIIFQLLRSY